ncbi:MAG TPA: glycoside hydrolase family 2 protein, partial [Polyangia bacterium]|nr:glycoside hydrolase family 2 protein [Polyangia bacterium]
GVPYVESSPMSHDDWGNLPNSGNCHISCWKYALFETGGHYERFREHFEQVCSFDSEFCIHGPPARRTMEAMLPPDRRWPPDDVWVYRFQRGHGNLPHYRQTLMVAGATFGEIDGLAKFVKHGQATHAEHMRAEFESARRDRPNNGGTMMWMYNDCWPTSNWSIIDYYRRPKPSYYAARRACAPLLPIVFERGGQVELFFSNDARRTCEAQLAFGRQRLDGETLWQEQARVTCGGCETVRFHRMPRDEVAGESGTYLFIDAVADGNPLPRVTYFPDLWKDVPWPRPNVQVEILETRQVEGTCHTAVAVTTDAYARFCHLVVDERLAPWFDDNFFDLCPGGRHVVNVRTSAPPAAEDIRVGHWWTDWP